VTEPVRDHGEQPIAAWMDERGLEPKDLVAASEGLGEGLTFKQVSRAKKGRHLTPRMRAKLLRAAIAAAGEELALDQLFDYR